MSEIGLKVSRSVVAEKGKKLPVISLAENNTALQVNIPPDNLSKISPAKGKVPSGSVTFSKEPPNNNKFLKSVAEGARIKGAIFGVEYMAAGAALGLGYKAAILKFVPEMAKNAPKYIGATGTLPKVLIIGGSSALIGLSLGTVKGAVDGAITGVSPSKGVAMGALAVTSALVMLPAFKISRAAGIVSVALGAVGGAFYGSHIYDKARK
jgi:hypothetical protein